MVHLQPVPALNRLPVSNHLLNALPADVLARLLPKFDQVSLPLGQGLYNQDTPIEAVYFPNSGMISMVAGLENGMRSEVGLIGHEGMLGTPLLAGADTSFVEAMVQMPGTAWRMGARDFRQELEANTPLRHILLRYNEAQAAQVMQTAACNGCHTLDQRLARWLLMVHDRADGGEMVLTQEFMAMMLSVHRPSVTLTAGILQRAGLIRYAAGHVTVLDRAGLEATSCECYGVVRRRFATVLGPKPVLECM